MKFEKTEVFNFNGAFRGMRNPKNSWSKSDSLFYSLPADMEDATFDDWIFEQAEKDGINTDDYLKYEEYRDYWYNKSWYYTDYETKQLIAIGKDDMRLARTLIEGGTEHRKFLRQISVCVDITAPLYWWKEFDTYKVGTVANSTSTMHKLTSKPIDMGCFEMDDYEPLLIIDEGIDDSGDTPYDYSYPIRDFVEPTEANVSFIYEETLVGFLELLRQKYLETNDKRYWKELVRWLPEGWLQTRTVTLNYENLRSIYNQRKNHKLTEWHQFCDWVKTLPYAEELIIN